MFFKFFTLLVITYLIYRSLRNLIDASVGGRQERNRFQKRPGAHGTHVRPPNRDEVRSEKSRTVKDIEDARWTDL